MTSTETREHTTPRELWRALRRHPGDLPERLMVLAVTRQGADAKAWARDRIAQGCTPRQESERLRRVTLIVSRADGAVSGTPFFVALVPAYVAFLWAQTRMVLRIAALYGHDPTDPHIAAELLALRGVYPSVPEAEAALERIGREQPPSGRLARIQSWVGMVKRILVLAAFTSASNPDEKPGRRRQAVMFVIGGAIWVVTWIVPLTFMILMAWSCDTSTRQLGAIALEFYSGEGVHDSRGLKSMRTAPEPGSGRRAFVRWFLVVVATAIPLVLLALSVRQGDALSDGGRVLAGLLGLSLVIVLSMVARR
jgi:hypothetical protein